MADIRPARMGDFMDGLQGQAGKSVGLPYRKNYSGDGESSLASIMKLSTATLQHYLSLDPGAMPVPYASSGLWLRLHLE